MKIDTKLIELLVNWQHAPNTARFWTISQDVQFPGAIIIQMDETLFGFQRTPKRLCWRGVISVDTLVNSNTGIAAFETEQVIESFANEAAAYYHRDTR